MKRLALLLVFLTCFLFDKKTLGQEVPNGDMEVWENVSLGVYKHPLNWITNNYFFTSSICSPILTAERTNDSHSGNWAAQLEAQECISDGGGEVLYTGYLALGTQFYYLTSNGISFSEKPAKFSFYYKFKKVGNDTGFAQIFLTALDSSYKPGKVIGQGSAIIPNDTNGYTLMETPINYFSLDTPKLMKIVFTTSKTLYEREFGGIDTAPGDGANTGTTLWIDDVTVSGGTLSSEDEKRKQINWEIFPNLFSDETNIKFNLPNADVVTVNLFTAQGVKVKEVFKNPVEGNRTYALKLNTKNLPSGFYLIQIQSSKINEVNPVILIR